MNYAEARELAFVLLDHRWGGQDVHLERCDCGVWLGGKEEWAEHVVTEYQRSLTAMAAKKEES